MGVSHIVAQKEVYFGGMGRLLEGRISKGRGLFWEGGIDSGNVTHSCRKGGYILERRGRFWERDFI